MVFPQRVLFLYLFGTLSAVLCRLDNGSLDMREPDELTDREFQRILGN